MGLTSLIPHCLAARETQGGGGNPLSQKVVGVKNSPPLTLISKIPLLRFVLAVTQERLTGRQCEERCAHHPNTTDRDKDSLFSAQVRLS